MFRIESIRHTWPEKPVFVIDRPSGHSHYTFLHFFNSVELLVGGEMIRTSPHACILYSPGTPQKFISRQPLVHDWIHFSGDLSGELSAAGLQTDRVFYPSPFDFITEITRECEAEFFASRTNREAMLTLKIRELFLKLQRAEAGEIGAPVDLDTGERLRKLRAQVFSSLSHNWTVSEMARAVSFSESRFFCVYKAAYGSSPVEDLIHARIDIAKRLLSTGNAPLSSVAEQLGYRNLSHFNRQFKGAVGMAPGAYRLLCREGKEVGPD